MVACIWRPGDDVDTGESGSGAVEMADHRVSFRDGSSRTNHAVIDNIYYMQRLLVSLHTLALFVYIC